MYRFLFFLLLVIPLPLPLRGQADRVHMKRGRPVVGAVWERQGPEVLVNVYRTRIRSVTHGTRRLDARRVKRISDDPDPHRAFWRRARALREGAASDWLELAQQATRAKLKGLAAHALEQALLKDRNSAPARKTLGSSRVKTLLASDPRFNETLRKELEDYLELEDPNARELERSELRASGCKQTDVGLERAWRSARQPRGRTEDRLLTLRSKENKGVYTLYVPRDYDPFTPTPLVVGLHGGGRGGKDGRAVVGSGKSAMNFYQAGAERRGWIVVCPTAVAAPWSARVNHAFVMAVLEEVELLFNIDLNRVYLTGHSMGGFGTWNFGPAYAHLWAAIAPMAGGGGGGLARLQKTNTGVYLYHGADDRVVGVGSDRAAAESMLSREMDFAYAEIPDSGHGFPQDVAREMWSFFELRRLAVAPRRANKGRFRVSERPYSSFQVKVTRDEVHAFGRPGGKAAAGGSSLRALVKQLAEGGGRAERAAASLGKLATPQAASAVSRVLQDQRRPEDVRRFAAESLGVMAQPAGAKALRRALLQEDLPVVVAAFTALAKVPGKRKPAAWRKGVARLLSGFDKKKIGAGMRYSDFEVYVNAAGAAAGALAAAGPEGAGRLVVSLAEGILLPAIEVPSLARAGHFPARLRVGLARSLMDALEVLADPRSRTVLEKLAARQDLGVVDRARALLERLKA